MSLPPRHRVLITGATGLVGSAIMAVANEFPELELIPIGSADGDLRSISQTASLFVKHTQLDGVIHLAARVGGLFRNMREPVEMMNDNMLINTNVIACAHAAGVQNLVACLSTCIFPDAVSRYPITMSDLHTGPPHPSNEGYAHAKRAMEVLTRAYQRQHGRRYFCVVPTNVYGPHDNFDLANAHVVPALIRRCCEAQQNSAEFVVAGDGSPLRQFVYSEDLARIMLRAYLEYENPVTPLVACPPGAEISIAEMVIEVVRSTGFEGAVRFDHSLPNGQHRKTCEVTPPAFSPPVWMSLTEGITKTVEWYKTKFTT